MLNTFYEAVGRLLSREHIRGIERMLRGAGYGHSAEAFAGFLILITALVAIAAFLVMLNYSVLQNFLLAVLPGSYLPDFAIVALTFIVAVGVVTFAVWMLAWVFLQLQGEARKAAVEAALPDFLSLISANVRSGMTVDQAMWYAAKPEFGILSIEVKNVIKSSFSGEPFEKALDRLSMRFNSKVLERTILLVKQAMATGGEVAEILEITSEDAREVSIQKKDIASTLLVYVIFLVFASVFGTPFLFSVASRLIEVLAIAFSYLPAGGLGSQVTQMTFVQPSAPIITADEFQWFSVATIFVTCLISSLLLGAIQSGSKTQGLKFFPFMLVVAYVVYFVVSSFLQSIFASML
ncbi:MAG: type II secretion system F family protein [Candidatus ainarchaeum sp.]|nr:type II secretion system F family protein [Candidatus ainarchaeum sp.]MDD5096801.1 type II secretion system F family protein [Candidatus ainarchaeum sp.]